MEWRHNTTVYQHLVVDKGRKILKYRRHSAHLMWHSRTFKQSGCIKFVRMRVVHTAISLAYMLAVASVSHSKHRRNSKQYGIAFIGSYVVFNVSIAPAFAHTGSVNRSRITKHTLHSLKRVSPACP